MYIQDILRNSMPVVMSNPCIATHAFNTSLRWKYHDLVTEFIPLTVQLFPLITVKPKVVI